MGLSVDPLRLVSPQACKIALFVSSVSEKGDLANSELEISFIQQRQGKSPWRQFGGLPSESEWSLQTIDLTDWDFTPASAPVNQSDSSTLIVLSGVA